MWGRRWLTSRASITAFSPIYSNILLHLETGKACVCLCLGLHIAHLYNKQLSRALSSVPPPTGISKMTICFLFLLLNFSFFLFYFLFHSFFIIYYAFVNSLLFFYVFFIFLSLILNVYFISSFLLSFILLPFSSGSHCQIVNWKVVFSMFSVKPKACRLSLLAKPPFPFILLMCNVLRD